MVTGTRVLGSYDVDAGSAWRCRYSRSKLSAAKHLEWKFLRGLHVDCALSSPVVAGCLDRWYRLLRVRSGAYCVSSGYLAEPPVGRPGRQPKPGHPALDGADLWIRLPGQFDARFADYHRIYVSICGPEPPRVRHDRADPDQHVRHFDAHAAIAERHGVYRQRSARRRAAGRVQPAA